MPTHSTEKLKKPLSSLSPSIFWEQPLHTLVLTPLLLFSHDLEGVGSIRNITRAFFFKSSPVAGERCRKPAEFSSPTEITGAPMAREQTGAPGLRGGLSLLAVLAVIGNKC